MNNQNFDNNKNLNNSSPEVVPNFASPADQKTAEGERMAANSKVLGIIGLITGIIGFGLVSAIINVLGLVMANNAKILLGYEHSDAKTGRVCATVGLVLAAVGFVVFLGMLIALPIIEANYAF